MNRCTAYPVPVEDRNQNILCESLYLTKARLRKMRMVCTLLVTGDYRARNRGGMGLRAILRNSDTVIQLRARQEG